MSIKSHLLFNEVEPKIYATKALDDQNLNFLFNKLSFKLNQLTITNIKTIANVIFIGDLRNHILRCSLLLRCKDLFFHLLTSFYPS